MYFLETEFSWNPYIPPETTEFTFTPPPDTPSDTLTDMSFSGDDAMEEDVDWDFFVNDSSDDDGVIV